MLRRLLKTKRFSEKGFAGFEVLIIIFTLGLVIGVSFYFWSQQNRGHETPSSGSSNTSRGDQDTFLYLPTNYAGDFKQIGKALFFDTGLNSPHYSTLFSYPSKDAHDGVVKFHPKFSKRTASIFNPPDDCGNGADYLKDVDRKVPCQPYTTTGRGRAVYVYKYGEGKHEAHTYYVLIDDYLLYIPVFLPKVSKAVLSEFIDSFEHAPDAEVEQFDPRAYFSE